MLILTRRIGEVLNIYTPDGKAMKVIMLATKGRQIRIGIEAPKDVQIVRAEIDKGDPDGSA